MRLFSAAFVGYFRGQNEKILDAGHRGLRSTGAGYPGAGADPGERLGHRLRTGDFRAGGQGHQEAGEKHAGQLCRQ